MVQRLSSRIRAQGSDFEAAWGGWPREVEPPGAWFEELGSKHEACLDDFRFTTLDLEAMRCYWKRFENERFESIVLRGYSHEAVSTRLWLMGLGARVGGIVSSRRGAWGGDLEELLTWQRLEVKLELGVFRLEGVIEEMGWDMDSFVSQVPCLIFKKESSSISGRDYSGTN